MTESRQNPIRLQGNDIVRQKHRRQRGQRAGRHRRLVRIHLRDLIWRTVIMVMPAD